MTKVLLNEPLLDYQRSMREWVDDLRNQKTGSLAKHPLPDEEWLDPIVRTDLLALSSYGAGLLLTPHIEPLFAYGFRGQADELIQIHTYDEFGVAAVHVSIRDAQGNVIESGYALENEYFTGHWCYITSVDIPSHTCITISVRAFDRLGGVGIGNCRMMVP
jgi:hypothetical protein